jgi:hypothetical protein
MYNAMNEVTVKQVEVDTVDARDLELGVHVITDQTARFPFSAAARFPFSSMKLNAKNAKILLSI